MPLLTLDIGSSSIKGAVLNSATGSIEAVVREPFPDPLSGMPAGFHEVSPDEIFIRAERVVQQLVKAAPTATTMFSCGQMGGIMLVEAEAAKSGQILPLTNYLSWRDQRTTISDSSGIPSLDRLRSSWSDDMFESLGKELKPGSATSLLHWIATHSQLPMNAMPISVGDFVISRLCKAVPQMERTQTIGMLNLRTNDWHHEAFEAAGIGSLHWPAMANEHTVIGRFSTEGKEISCYSVIGDQQAALKGIDLQSDELSVNASTGSQVSQITSTFQPAECQTRCWFGGQFLNTITHIPAGRSLTVLEALLTELARLSGTTISDSWAIIAKQTEASSGDGLRCDLSFFASAMGCDGRIEGITTENLTVGNLFQAAFEFMADSYLTCSQRLNRNPDWKQLAVSGGLVQRFASLRTKLTARFPLPFREIAEQEETLLGLWKIAKDAPAT